MESCLYRDFGSVGYAWLSVMSFVSVVKFLCVQILSVGEVYVGVVGKV